MPTLPPPPPPSPYAPGSALWLAASRAPDARTFASHRCEATLWFPAPGVVATRVTGSADGETTRAVYAAVDARWATHGPQSDGFVDLGDLEDVDWEARTTALRWNLAHRAHAQRLHVLVCSPAVHLAARIFTLAFPERMQVHEARSAFESQYALVVKMRSARSRASSAPPSASGSDAAARR